MTFFFLENFFPLLTHFWGNFCLCGVIMPSVCCAGLILMSFQLSLNDPVCEHILVYAPQMDWHPNPCCLY